MNRALRLAVTFVVALLLGSNISLTPFGSVASAEEPKLIELSGDLGVHDPVIAKDGSNYYVFYTGGRRGMGNVPMLTSTDMKTWKNAGMALPPLAPWVGRVVPAAGNTWAPDIAKFNGKWHLYYAVSSFGVNDSAIGLATNKTLDPQSPDYKWEDQGLVVGSASGATDFNCIDANLVVEDDKNVWLNWGSFWGGIMMRRIDPATGKLAEQDKTLYKLATRPRGDRTDESSGPPQRGAIEAPFIFKHGNYWYLFVSFDFCCRGANSDYKVAVGRSEKITGPYVDKDGKKMSEGGGTVIMQAATDNWHGVGHEAIFSDNGTDYMIVHAYPADPMRRGSFLHISTIVWEDGWPRVAQLP